MPFKGQNGFDANSQRITNVGTPTATTDAANRSYVDLRGFGAVATAGTSIGTTITAVTGMSLAVPSAGTWKIEAHIPAVIVGSPTAFTITVSPVSGPTTTTLRLTASAQRSGATGGRADATAFNSAMALGALTAVATTFTVQGAMVATSAETISISMTRTGGTSVTTQPGAYIQLERLA